MFCPKCGKINPDESELCSGCGAVLSEEKEKEPRKKGKALKIVLTAIVVIAIVCVAVCVLNGCGVTNIPKEKMSF